MEEKTNKGKKPHEQTIHTLSEPSFVISLLTLHIFQFIF